MKDIPDAADNNNAVVAAKNFMVSYFVRDQESETMREKRHYLACGARGGV